MAPDCDFVRSWSRNDFPKPKFVGNVRSASIGSGVNNSIRQLGSVFGIAFAVLRVGTESANAVPGFTALYSGLTTAAVITALLGAFVRTAPEQKRSLSVVVRDSVETGLRANSVVHSEQSNCVGRI